MWESWEKTWGLSKIFSLATCTYRVCSTNEDGYVSASIIPGADGFADILVMKTQYKRLEHVGKGQRPIVDLRMTTGEDASSERVCV